MSLPIQQSGSVPFGQSAQPGPTSYVTGQISYGWIGESWRLFSAQMGPWIVGGLVLAAPAIVFGIVLYAMMLSTMFAGGFSPTTPPTTNGLPTTPLNPTGAASPFNAKMATIFPLELGFFLVYAFWSAYVYGGLFRMAVLQVRGVPIDMKDIFRGRPLFGRMLGAIFLLGLCAYGLEALCLAPMGLSIWRHGSALTTGLTAATGFVLVFVLLFLAYGLLLPAFALVGDGIGVIPALKRSAMAMRPRMGAAAGFVFVYGLLLYASELLCGIGLLATIPMIFLICALAYRDMVGMPDMAPSPGPTYAPSAPGVWPPAPGTWPPPPNAAPPQQYPNFPPQQYSPPPVQQYPSETPTQYPPAAEPEPSDETPPNPWQPRPSPPPQGE